MSHADYQKRRTARAVQRRDTAVGGLDVHGQLDAGVLDAIPQIAAREPLPVVSGAEATAT